jgi:SAM-dependent methyltransferase
MKYADPMPVSGPAECYFYHSLNLPEFGEIKGHWDLRDVATAYLGNVDYEGKRVLDVGTASGFLTFEMEKMGADVVSFDIDDGANWDVVPHFAIRNRLNQIRIAQRASDIMLKKGYWLSHGQLKSKAKVVYGNIYDMPKDMGAFDVVFYGMIVGHLRDVFQALYNGARLCTDTMIVTSMFAEGEQPVAKFWPKPEDSSNYAIKSWWGLNIGVMRAMLGVLGFEIVDLVNCSALSLAPGFEGRHKCTAIVGKRVAQTPPA